MLQLGTDSVGEPLGVTLITTMSPALTLTLSTVLLHVVSVSAMVHCRFVSTPLCISTNAKLLPLPGAVGKCTRRLRMDPEALNGTRASRSASEVLISQARVPGATGVKRRVAVALGVVYDLLSHTCGDGVTAEELELEDGPSSPSPPVSCKPVIFQ